jgi:hypothetical protein
MKYLLLALFSMTMTGIASADMVEACVDERVAYFHQEHGKDAPIRFDILGEWEEECRENAAMLANPVQACVEKRIAYFRQVHGQEAPIRFDILAEWEEECQ